MKLSALLFALCAMFAVSARAETLAIAKQGDLTVTLTDEPCTLRVAKNLMLRAVWTDPNGTFEGCWNVFHETGMVGAYFEDQTFAVLPAQVFLPGKRT